MVRSVVCGIGRIAGGALSISGDIFADTGARLIRWLMGNTTTRLPGVYIHRCIERGTPWTTTLHSDDNDVLRSCVQAQRQNNNIRRSYVQAQRRDSEIGKEDKENALSDDKGCTSQVLKATRALRGCRCRRRINGKMVRKKTDPGRPRTVSSRVIVQTLCT